MLYLGIVEIMRSYAHGYYVFYLIDDTVWRIYPDGKLREWSVR